jgi:hypothetical protein
LNRTELQQLSQHRLLDAKALIAASRWSGAYYLSGYAIECALKAAVLRYVERTGIIFEDKWQISKKFAGLPSRQIPNSEQTGSLQKTGLNDPAIRIQLKTRPNQSTIRFLIRQTEFFNGYSNIGK